MNEFLQRVENEIQKRKLFSRGQKILVAVSGGVDSMVLLHVLNSFAAKNRWQISIAHFNHTLRGRASDADEKLVRQTAKKLQLKFFCKRADIKKFAAQAKISVEMAARKLRHEFFARVAREQKIPVIALAHHADDQIELFFLRLLRGAGGDGLAGMKWLSPSPANGQIRLARPLLGFSKNEILEFARENKIKFRHDASNFETDFLRNRIRNELIPLLQKRYQSQIGKTVLRAMEIVGAETEFVGEMARHWRAKTDFEKWPSAIQRKMLQQRLLESGVAPDFELVEQLRETPQKLFSVGSGLAVSRAENGEVKLLRLREPEELDFRRDELKLNLSGRAGQAEFGGKGFFWQVRSQKQSLVLKKESGCEFFDADKIGGEIILRHWRAGDRFQPIGLKSAAKLQDLFVNAKIPRERRHKLILATAARGEIFWVEDLRIGEKFKLTPETRRRLVWEWSILPI